jgi:metal-sulfur cluster biosynthetic enzyme
MVKVNKIQIIKALEEVIFFPKGNNIVALKMVNDIVIDKNQITIEIVFEDPKAKTAEIVENSSINAIKKHFPDLTQTIKIIRKAKALSYTDGNLDGLRGEGGCFQVLILCFLQNFGAELLCKVA